MSTKTSSGPAAILLIGVIALGAAGAWKFGFLDSYQRTSDAQDVVYRIFSEPTSHSDRISIADISYVNEAGILTDVIDQSLDWRKIVPVPRWAVNAEVNGYAQSPGSLSCQILKHGKVMAEKTVQVTRQMAGRDDPDVTCRAYVGGNAPR